MNQPLGKRFWKDDQREEHELAKEWLKFIFFFAASCGLVTFCLWVLLHCCPE
jgi:hypothetical protein